MCDSCGCKPCKCAIDYLQIVESPAGSGIMELQLSVMGCEFAVALPAASVDTFGVEVIATADGVDNAGNAYAAGDELIMLPGGELYCQKKTVDTDTDTFAMVSQAPADGVDEAGNAFLAGDTITTYPNGDIICEEKSPDTFAQTVVAAADGVDENGNPYLAGDKLIQLPNGDLYCSKKSVETIGEATGDPDDSTTWTHSGGTSILDLMKDASGKVVGFVKPNGTACPLPQAVFEFDETYNPVDGDSPSGSGTTADPFLLPVPDPVAREWCDSTHVTEKAPVLVATSAPPASFLALFTAPLIDGDGGAVDYLNASQYWQWDGSKWNPQPAKSTIKPCPQTPCITVDLVMPSVVPGSPLEVALSDGSLVSADTDYSALISSLWCDCKIKVAWKTGYIEYQLGSDNTTWSVCCNQTWQDPIANVSGASFDGTDSTAEHDNKIGGDPTIDFECFSVTGDAGKTYADESQSGPDSVATAYDPALTNSTYSGYAPENGDVWVHQIYRWVGAGPVPGSPITKADIDIELAAGNMVLASESSMRCNVLYIVDSDYDADDPDDDITDHYVDLTDATSFPCSICGMNSQNQAEAEAIIATKYGLELGDATNGCFTGVSSTGLPETPDFEQCEPALPVRISTVNDTVAASTSFSGIGSLDCAGNPVDPCTAIFTFPICLQRAHRTFDKTGETGRVVDDPTLHPSVTVNLVGTALTFDWAGSVIFGAADQALIEAEFSTPSCGVLNANRCIIDHIYTGKDSINLPYASGTDYLAPLGFQRYQEEDIDFIEGAEWVLHQATVTEGPTGPCPGAVSPPEAVEHYVQKRIKNLVYDDLWSTTNAPNATVPAPESGLYYYIQRQSTLFGRCGNIVQQVPIANTRDWEQTTGTVVYQDGEPNDVGVGINHTYIPQHTGPHADGIYKMRITTTNAVGMVLEHETLYKVKATNPVSTRWRNATFSPRSTSPNITTQALRLAQRLSALAADDLATNSYSTLGEILEDGSSYCPVATTGNAVVQWYPSTMEIGHKYVIDVDYTVTFPNETVLAPWSSSTLAEKNVMWLTRTF